MARGRRGGGGATGGGGGGGGGRGGRGGGKKRGGDKPRGGFGQISIGDELKIAVNLSLKKFIDNAEETELSLPSSLYSTERAYVHKVAAEMGLQSKSRGKGQTRYITVFKKEKSTIVAKDAVLELSEESLKLVSGLLARSPLSGKDRVSLSASLETRLTRPSTGRLGGGVSQVPPAVTSTEFQAARQSLPIWPHRSALLSAVSASQVVLVTGDTGSGKTTQVLQYLLEEATLNNQAVRMVCCQPRRLTTVTVAERVAVERGEKVGGTVGYQIRLESCISPRTVATFCTYGVLLRSLCGATDLLDSITHVLIDEIHEREAMADFLLTVMKDTLARNKKMKLVLMSATLDTQLFLDYFPDCRHISLAGRMFPVEEFSLEKILLSSSYSSKEMERLRRCGEVQRSATMEELTSSLARLQSEDVTAPAEEEKKKNILQEEDKVVLEEMDKILEKCFLDGGEEHFVDLQEELSSEGGEVLVNYSHSVTGVTSLIAAATRGVPDLVELCLQLGANTAHKLGNGWTALDCARQQGQEECEQLLVKFEEKQDGSVVELSQEMTEEEREVLRLYTASVDTDQVDHDLVLHLLRHIHTTQPEGAVLVFLPGYEDITTIFDLITEDPGLSGETTVVLLHSQMPSSEHKKSFKPPARGCRKVVLATNVAETGITIQDIVYVIDSGKVKVKSYDALTNTTLLKSEWISKTSATQRKGRAGRCQAGQVYRLFSSIVLTNMAQFSTPEILRTSLLSLCLQTKLLSPPNTPISDFLAKVPDPPSFLVTRTAVQNLKTMGALDTSEEMTALGLHLLDIPLEPVLGKILLHSVILRCLDPVLSITCMLAYKSPFTLAVDQSRRKAGEAVKRNFSAGTGSDHMAWLRAFQEWQLARVEQRERRWCREHQVSNTTMEMVAGIRNQVLAQLRASGFVKARGPGDIKSINVNSNNWSLVKACLMSGLYPNIVRVDKEEGRESSVLRTQRESKVKLSPGSVLNSATLQSLNTDWLLYEEMSRVGRMALVRGVTPISPITLALFGGSDQSGVESGAGNVYLEETSDSEVEEGEGNGSSLVMVDTWTVFNSNQETSQLVSQLRQKWAGVWGRRLCNTSKQSRLGVEEVDDDVVSTIVQLLYMEDIRLGLVQPMGVGQRPKNVAVDIMTGLVAQPGGRRNPATSEEEPVVSNDFVSNNRYFLVRPSTGSLPALEAAMSHPQGVWSFPSLTERKLMSAVAAGDQQVITIFSVQNSGAIQGAGVFTGHHQVQGSRTGVLMQWMTAGRKPVMLSSLPIRLESSRDGQEVETATAQSLLGCLGVFTGPPSTKRRLDRERFYR